MSELAENIVKCELGEKQTAVWYLGQEGFLLKNRGKYAVVDPYLSDYVDKNCCQYVKWVRKYPAPIGGGELDFIDTVICTHPHYDHTDPWTLTAIAAVNTKAVFIVPAPSADTAASYGIDRKRIIAARADMKIEISGLTITPVPAAHETLHIDKNGDYRELGYIIDNGRARIFHAGDMCMYDGLTERLSDIDIACLPINGRDYFRNRSNIIGNLDCAEAVLLAKEIDAKLLVPMHHDLYEVNGVNPAVFVDTLMRLNRAQSYHIFTPAERYIYQ